MNNATSNKRNLQLVERLVEEDVHIDEDTQALYYRGQHIRTDAELGNALNQAVLRYNDARRGDPDVARIRFDDVLFLTGATWARLGERR